MDREILFRGKRLDNKKWVYGYLICCAGRQFIVDQSNPTALRSFTTHHCDRYDWRSVEITPSTVSQYTGLTDKNGKKIFEGDIVAAGYYKWKCQVVWDGEGARFICYTLEGERRIVYVDMVDKYDKSALEVIGNIHDQNPLIAHGVGE